MSKESRQKLLENINYVIFQFDFFESSDTYPG